MIQYEKVNDDFNLPIRLIRFEGDIGQPVHKHWHNSLEIVLPICGGEYAWVDGRYYKLYQENMMPLIINSRSIHAFESGCPKPYIGLALLINYQFLKEVYPEIDHIHFKQPDEEVGMLVKKQLFLINEYYETESTHKDLLITSALFHLIYLLVEHLSVDKKDKVELKSEKNKHRIISIINYIDDNYQEDLTIEQLSEVFHLSEGHLSKLFKENLGMTIKAYISQTRAKEVRNALLTSDLPLIDIAITCGFPNVKSMNKVFKDLYQCTPSQFRRNCK